MGDTCYFPQYLLVTAEQPLKEMLQIAAACVEAEAYSSLLYEGTLRT